MDNSFYGSPYGDTPWEAAARADTVFGAVFL